MCIILCSVCYGECEMYIILFSVCHRQCEMCIILCSLFATDTAIPLSDGEDGLLRAKNCTGQLNTRRNVVAVVRKEHQNCDRL